MYSCIPIIHIILNLVKLNQIWTLITLFRIIWDQRNFDLVPIQSEKCDYIPNLVWFNKIQNRVLYVYILKIYNIYF